MSVWELFGLRHQNTAQQTQIDGLRGESIQQRMAASTARLRVETLELRTRSQQQRTQDLTRELDRTLDDYHASQRELRAARQLLTAYANWTQSRARLLASLRAKLGTEVLSQALGEDFDRHCEQMDAAIGQDATWVQQRNALIEDDLEAYTNGSSADPR